MALGYGSHRAARRRVASALPLAPIFTVLPAIGGVPRVGQTLTGSDGTIANGVAASRRWLRDGAAIAGATGSGYVAVSGDAGSALTYDVTATGAGGTATASAPAVIILPLAPALTAAPVLGGTAQEGQALSVSDGTWANAPTGFAYQWNRDGAAIAGSVNATRTLTAADVGHVLACTVTASNAGGSASATSAASASITAAAVPVPVNTTAPVASGNAVMGSTLTSSTGAWSNSPTAYAYQWRRDGVDIAGATASTYITTAADIGRAITCRVLATNAGGTAGASSGAITALAPGASATSFGGSGVTPALHYHIPAGSTVSTETISYAPLGNPAAATSVSDLRGLADAVNAAHTGPLVRIDGLGRKYLRFTTPAGGSGADHGGPNGANLLQIPGVSLASRGIAVFMVGRHHRGTTGFFTLGVAGGTIPNPGGPILGTQAGNSGGAPYVRAGSRYANVPLSGNASRLVIGSQMQVIGMASRVAAAGANGGTRMYLNTDAVMHSQLTSVSGTGATIGTIAGSSDFFDLYEMAVFTGDLSDAQADAVAARLVAKWSIPAVVDQVVLSGDSITAGIVAASDDGTLGVLAGWNLSMLLTDPGAELYPTTTRVVNAGSSGQTLAGIVTLRDQANGQYDTGKLSSGRNIVAFQIGRNDWSDAASGTTEYQKITGTGAYTATGLITNTAGTGYLNRGWEVAAAINIATGSLEPARLAQVAALRASSFLTDCTAGSGQTYAGKLRRIDLAAITVGGVTRFASASDAGGSATYQNDTTHPNRTIGTPLMATGGDTPANGYRAVV